MNLMWGPKPSVCSPQGSVQREKGLKREGSAFVTKGESTPDRSPLRRAEDRDGDRAGTAWAALGVDVDTRQGHPRFPGEVISPVLRHVVSARKRTPWLSLQASSGWKLWLQITVICLTDSD